MQTLESKVTNSSTTSEATEDKSILYIFGTFDLFILSRCLITYCSQTINKSLISYRTAPFESSFMDVSEPSFNIIIYYTAVFSFTNIPTP